MSTLRNTSQNPAEQNLRAVARLEQAALRSRSLAARISDRVTALASSGASIAFHALWFAMWLLINEGWTSWPPFDPFPFSLLTVIVSLETIFLTLFVLASQNRLARETDKREHLDLQVNLLAEQEMTVVLRMLKELCDHFDLHQTAKSQTFRELLQETNITDLAERVERTLPIEGTAKPDANR